MATSLNRLSARKVTALSEPGRYADGGGLYLVVDPSGAKRWMFRYSFGGKRREMGLGSLNAVPMQRARELAQAARESLGRGLDPLGKTDSPAQAPTFGEIALAYMAARETIWRNPVHRRQWRYSLETHASHIWSMPVDQIDTSAVLAVLEPMWSKLPETAKRTRGRMEHILDTARVAGHRTGENPARWRGHLSLALPKPRKLIRGHHAAMPYPDVPAFMAALAKRDAPSALALRFTILTAARSGEVRGMKRGEVDLDARVWTVPASRMKAGRPHRVPLSDDAAQIIRSQGINDPDALVFPGPTGKPMSDMVFNALVRRLGHDGITTHGFRSSFRDWVSEETDFPRELAEAALAHLVGDETERAYRRGDALQKRRALMDHWAAFCGSMTGSDSR